MINNSNLSCDNYPLVLFHAVPFTPEQWDGLFGIARKGGLTPVLCDDDVMPDVSILENAAAMMGAFPTEWLSAATRLQWVQAPSAGIEPYLGLPDSVTLTNASGAFGVTIAEYMVAGLLMLYRRMPLYLEHQRRHEWCPEPANRTLKGSVVTVIGLGDLGETFARRVRPFGAKVRGVRRSVAARPDFVDELFIVDNVDDAITDADVIALCLPDTQSTRGLLSARRIGMLKSGAVVINTGRGSAIDEPALIEALRSGRLGGAILDVFAQEPLPSDSPLWTLDNVIATPHISGRAYDPHNLRIIFDLFSDNLARFIKGEPLMNVVDRIKGY